jgi:Trypsin-like peptidase domain
MNPTVFRIGCIVVSCVGVLHFPGSAQADLSSFLRRLASPAPQVPHPAIVQIQVQEQEAWARGSGTLIAANEQYGWVITNWHVVRGGDGTAFLAFPGGHQTQGRVIKMDQVWDLALIVIPRPPVQPISLAATVPAIGEPLTIAGYGSGDFRAARGRCTNYAAPDTQHPQEMIDVSVAARQGDSGGPILNDRSELAGVLFGAGEGATTGTHVGRVRMFLLSSEPPSEQIAAGEGHHVVAPRQVASARVQPAPHAMGFSQGTPVPVPTQVTGFQQQSPNSDPLSSTSTAGIDPSHASTYGDTGSSNDDPFAAIEAREAMAPTSVASVTASLRKPDFATPDQATSKPATPEQATTAQAALTDPASPPPSSATPVVESKSQMQCDPESGVCRLVPRTDLAGTSDQKGAASQFAGGSTYAESASHATNSSSSLNAAIDPHARARKLDDTTTFLLFVGAVGALVYFAPRQPQSSGAKPKKASKKVAKKRKAAVIEEEEEEDEDED